LDVWPTDDPNKPIRARRHSYQVAYMLLVILGAGASYDSLPAYWPRNLGEFEERPPLADELFDNRAIFGEAMTGFAMVQPIVPLLQRRHGQSLERRLQELAQEASDYPARYQKLMAVRYYIQ